MKRSIKNLNLIMGLTAGFGVAVTAMAQTFSVIHTFTATVSPSYTNSDGATPYAGLALSSSTLYGVAYEGGAFVSQGGTLFALNTDGSGFTTLHSFGQLNSDQVSGPFGGVVLSGNTIHGTAQHGGDAGYGTVFTINTDGSGYTTLYNFTGGSDGANPTASLVLSADTLYGTTSLGFSGATLFKLNTNGTGFTVLHSFAGPQDPTVIVSGGTLYGTTIGVADNGTVFSLGTDGTGFTTLHSFSPTSGSLSTNADGANPAGLILSGSTLYGTAYYGGTSGWGTVFALDTNGTGFTTLYSFPAVSGPNYTNSDGAHPEAGLVLSGDSLYGTAGDGGPAGYGTVFRVKTNGTGFMALHGFSAATGQIAGGLPVNSDGAYPYHGVVLSGYALYGTADEGGNFGNGTVFKLSFQPQLTIAPLGRNIILAWPTNYAGFDYSGFTLQCTTNLSPSAVWSGVSPGPVVVNGQKTVTNPISPASKFYRLIQ